MIIGYSKRFGGRFLSQAVLLATLTLRVLEAADVASDLRRATGSTVNVIVQFRHAPGEPDHQKIGRHGGTLQRELQLIHAAAYSLPADAVSRVAADPDVVYVSPDRQVQGSLDYADETINATIALEAGLDGSGVGDASLDSGITEAPDLNGTDRKAASRFVYSENFVDSSSDVSDHYGHGTHIAGIVAGDG